MYKSIITTIVLVAAGFEASKITPIRLSVLTDDKILKLCLGNLIKITAPGQHNLADIKLNLEKNKKFNCGPSNTLLAKGLIDAILLNEGVCSKIGLLNARKEKSGNAVGGVNIVLRDIVPGCDASGYENNDREQQEPYDGQLNGADAAATNPSASPAPIPAPPTPIQAPAPVKAPASPASVQPAAPPAPAKEPSPPSDLQGSANSVKPHGSANSIGTHSSGDSVEPHGYAPQY